MADDKGRQMVIYCNFIPNQAQKMRRLLYLLPGLLCSIALMGQKKPLDHSVYDGWQSIGERAISNNGKYVAYAITPQEGDGTLVLQAADNSWKKEIARGYGAVISEDSRFVIFKIRAPFKDTREARIKKKTPNDMPKDSLGIVELGKTDITRIPRVKSFKTPAKGTGQWMAYLLEKALPETPKAAKPDSLTQVNNLLHMADSLARVADSLRGKASEAQSKGLAVLQAPKKEGGKTGSGRGEEVEEGTELVLRNLQTGEEKKFKLVNDYVFSEPGNVLVYKTTRKNSDSESKAALLWVSLPDGKTDTVMRKFNDVKNIAVDENGRQLAFVAERDSVTKALQKF